MSARVMFLDDARPRYQRFRERFGAKFIIDWAQTAKEAVALLEKNEYALVMLDHDLDEQHYEAFTTGAEYVGETGMAVAQWIAATASRFSGVPIVVHSLNGPAANAMVAKLAEAGLAARHVPFGWETLVLR